MNEPMSEAVPDDVRKAGNIAGTKCRMAMAETEWKREAASLWACPGIIDQMNEAFARAILAERLAERERCAKIAENHQFEEAFTSKAANIASAIRAGS